MTGTTFFIKSNVLLTFTVLDTTTSVYVQRLGYMFQHDISSKKTTDMIMLKNISGARTYENCK